jgi:hypothetical protein
VAPTSGAICLGIYFDIEIGTIQIPHTKLQEVLSLYKFYFSKSKITKKQLRALLGSITFIHKAIKPARLFVNRILALLWEMGEATAIAIDEASKQDLQWFIACARAVNGTVSIYKCLHIPGKLNQVGDLLSRWSASRRPLATLFSLLNQVPVWLPVPSNALDLNYTI